MLINLSVFVVLLILVNWMAGVLYRSGAFSPGQVREYLPVCSREDSIAQAVKDYHQMNAKYVPYVGWVMKGEDTPTIHVNEKGIREHKPPGRVSDGAPEVFFFGGSTMWGQFVKDSKTIPALFNEYKKEFKVVNHGQIAYNSHQELISLANLYYLGERPEYVLFYDGWNDAGMFCSSEVNPPDHFKVFEFERKINGNWYNWFRSGLHELFVRNILLVGTALKEKDEKIHGASKLTMATTPYGFDCCDDPEKLELVTEGLLRNWKMAKDLVENRGGRFIALLQPVAFYGSPDIRYLGFGREEISRKDFAEKKNYEAFYDLLRRKILEKEYNTWVFDLSDSFDGQKVYIDRGHVTARGNDIIARRIAAIFDQMQAATTSEE